MLGLSDELGFNGEVLLRCNQSFYQWKYVMEDGKKYIVLWSGYKAQQGLGCVSYSPFPWFILYQ